MIKTKAVSLVLTLFLMLGIILPSGCSADKGSDAEEIKEVTERFIEAYGSGNTGVLDEIVKDGLVYADLQTTYGRVFIEIVAMTEVDDYEYIDVDRKDRTAVAKVTLYVLDTEELDKRLGDGIVLEEDVLEEIYTLTMRRKETLMLNYAYDIDNGRWQIKQSSAEDILDLFNHMKFPANLSKHSPEEAEMIFNRIFDDFSKGDFDQVWLKLDRDAIRVFDDGSYDDPAVTEAAEAFAKAYFGYIYEHGVTIDHAYDSYFHVNLKGFAPSHIALLDYMSGDEFVTRNYRTVLTGVNRHDPDTETEAIYCEMFADLYTAMAEQVADMESEEYTIECYFDPTKSAVDAKFEGELIPIPADKVEAASIISGDQRLRCKRQAIEDLYASGEYTKEQYDQAISDLELDITLTKDPSYYLNENVDWEGTENYRNQAVNVTESIPDWAWADGMILGTSGKDGNGYSMEYLKSSGWLDTAGYCISDGGITVLLKFVRAYSAGTVLICDWSIDGQETASETFTVETDGTDVFEFILPGTELGKYGTCEFSLWNEKHDTVLAVVRLTKT